MDSNYEVNTEFEYFDKLFELRTTAATRCAPPSRTLGAVLGLARRF
jgi:hypothetical protein